MIMIRRKRPQEEGAPTRFLPGELVRHRRYGYRGVVVDFDMKCLAPEDWYVSNKTQPPRRQPWYHVLVHGTVQTTYAAESSLAVDEGFEEIVHPLVSVYFDRFESGLYVRNDRPWGM